MINCVITKNTANRGGVDDSMLYGCIVADNTATEAGGGTLQSTLYNCTVTGNSAHRNGGGASKRFNGVAAYTCIIHGNKAALAPNYGEDDYSRVLLRHCCTTPPPSFGEGNIDSDPLPGNFRLVGGGGAYGGTLHNCVISGNGASTSGGVGGGAVHLEVVGSERGLPSPQRLA